MSEVPTHCGLRPQVRSFEGPPRQRPPPPPGETCVQVNSYSWASTVVSADAPSTSIRVVDSIDANVGCSVAGSVTTFVVVDFDALLMGGIVAPGSSVAAKVFIRR